MIEYATRLKRGQDLKKAIEIYCLSNNINTGIILSSVGCISSLHIRKAKAIECLKVDDDFEILSLNGTISDGKAHLHIAVSDEKATVLGGHLLEGTIINTTVELVIGALQSYKSSREYDDETGYDEIEFKEI